MEEILTYNDSENQIKNQDNEIIKEIINLYNQIYEGECSSQYYGYIYRIYKKIYYSVINKNRKMILFLIIILFETDIDINKNINKDENIINISIHLIKYISILKNNVPGAKYIDYKDEKLLTVFFTYIHELIYEIDIYRIMNKIDKT